LFSRTAAISFLFWMIMLSRVTTSLRQMVLRSSSRCEATADGHEQVRGSDAGNAERTVSTIIRSVMPRNRLHRAGDGLRPVRPSKHLANMAMAMSFAGDSAIGDVGTRRRDDLHRHEPG
jgi:hypothetical protein